MSNASIVVLTEITFVALIAAGGEPNPLKSYLVLFAVLLFLFLLLVQACNNRPRPFKEWREFRQQRWQQRRETNPDDQQVDPQPQPDNRRRFFRRHARSDYPALSGD